MIVLIKILPNSDFTTISTILATTLALSPLFSTPSSTAANAFLPSTNDKSQTTREITTISLATGVLAMGTAYSCYKYINTSSAHPIQTSYIILSSLTPFFSVLSNTHIGILHGVDDFKKASTISYFRSTLLLVLGITLSFTLGIFGFIIALFCTAFTTWCIGLILINKCNLPIFPATPSEITRNPKLYNFAIPTLLSSATGTATKYLTSLQLLSSGNSFQFAIFNIISNWQFATQILPASLSPSTILSLSYDRSKKNINKTRKKFIKATILPAFIAVLVSPLILHIYSIWSLENNVAFITLNFATALTSYTTFYGAYLSSQKRRWAALVFNIVWCAIFFLTLPTPATLTLTTYTNAFLLTAAIYTVITIASIETIINKHK